MGWNSKGRGGQGPAGARALTANVCLAALGFVACGLLPSRGGDEAPESRPEGMEVRAGTVEAAPDRRFEAPGELDQLADARPIALPPVKPLGASAPAAKAQSESAGKGPA